MPGLQYTEGDIRSPKTSGKVIVAHCCNDQGRMGRGVAKAIYLTWPLVRRRYMAWANGELGVPMELGMVQFVEVEKEQIWVANMIGQHDTVTKAGIPPIRYEALEQALRKVAERARKLGAEVHMPKIGSALAKGDWKKIEEIVQRILVDQGVPTTVYIYTDTQSDTYEPEYRSPGR